MIYIFIHHWVRMQLPNLSTICRVQYKERLFFFIRITAYLKSGFSFTKAGCLTKVKQPSLSNYISIAGERTDRLIDFSQTLIHCKMQMVSARNWTQVSPSISYNNNLFATHASIAMCIWIYTLRKRDMHVYVSV